MAETTPSSLPSRKRRSALLAAQNSSDSPASSASPSSPSDSTPTESSETRTSCPMCSETFNRAEHLNRHMRRHTGEKPFQCPDCGKLFSRSDSMKRHRALHTENDSRSNHHEQSTATAQNSSVLQTGDFNAGHQGAQEQCQTPMGFLPFSPADCGQIQPTLESSTARTFPSSMNDDMLDALSAAGSIVHSIDSEQRLIYGSDDRCADGFGHEQICVPGLSPDAGNSTPSVISLSPTFTESEQSRRIHCSSPYLDSDHSRRPKRRRMNSDTVLMDHNTLTDRMHEHWGIVKLNEMYQYGPYATAMTTGHGEHSACKCAKVKHLETDVEELKARISGLSSALKMAIDTFELQMRFSGQIAFTGIEQPYSSTYH